MTVAAVAGTEVRLPVGLFRDGAHCQVASLRPLAGHDEIRLQEAAAAGASRVGLVTDLLAGCTTAIGPIHPVDAGLVDALCIGDREALLLHLRRLTFGDALDLGVACPACAGLLDLALNTADLLVPPAEPCVAEPVVTADIDGTRWQVRLRRVTGADLAAQVAVTAVTAEEVEVEVLGSAADTTRALLRRCVLAIDGAPAGAATVETLPPALVATLDLRLAELDPQGEIRLDITCPTCRHPFTALFDAAGQLMAELSAGAGQLIGEIAVIAHAFHWTEHDILALPRPRRQAYAAWAARR